MQRALQRRAANAFHDKVEPRFEVLRFLHNAVGSKLAELACALRPANHGGDVGAGNVRQLDREMAHSA